MKTGIKNVGHEITYLVVLTIILVALSITVFPLFIALLPIAFIYGCSEIWRLDHLKGKVKEKAGWLADSNFHLTFR